ncbi:hypothetical protein ACMYR3_00060 [Ampullimonas aquatilis]|uniref:hypothetical protein n=1 Tax=Ampullimonas aquatilis TaxID=1341549 RepID=UPI003C72039C
MMSLSLSIKPVHCFGLKGAGSVEWLMNQGVSVPALPNCYGVFGEQGVIARLAYTEFYFDDVNRQSSQTLQSLLGKGVQVASGGVYPVCRDDVVLQLSGSLAHVLLAQVCSFHFAAWDITGQPLIMTSMVGVSVIILPLHGRSNDAGQGNEPTYQVVCDPSLAVYLEKTLREVMQDTLQEHALI